MPLLQPLFSWRCSCCCGFFAPGLFCFCFQSQGTGVPRQLVWQWRVPSDIWGSRHQQHASVRSQVQLSPWGCGWLSWVPCLLPTVGKVSVKLKELWINCRKSWINCCKGSFLSLSLPCSLCVKRCSWGGYIYTVELQLTEKVTQWCSQQKNVRWAIYAEFWWSFIALLHSTGWPRNLGCSWWRRHGLTTFSVNTQTRRSTKLCWTECKHWR